jgi:galactosylceramidase
MVTVALAKPFSFRRVFTIVTDFFMRCLGLLFFLCVWVITPLPAQVIELKGDAGGKRFDGIGIVDGGGATSVLFKDYPEPQRSQILDLVFKPKFGASVSSLLVEIPGDGNATQGSMPSHMHTRDDLNYSRGYMWWIMREAKLRNPKLVLDGAAWSAPGWVGDGKFWSQDMADYYVKWLQGLRKVYGLEFDAIGCRNESGTNYPFAEMLRASLDANGFEKVRVHGFDNWTDKKMDFVKDMAADPKLRDAIGIISAHTFLERPASAEVQQMSASMNKPIWDTEEHIYLKGFDCAISIVRAFNENYIQSGATRITNWYDIAGVYPTEGYAEDPTMLIARWPWCGHYQVREALWGYAHYGQFTEPGWTYLNGGCGDLPGGGSYVTMKSQGDDYSIILETKLAKAAQQVSFHVGGGLSGKDLSVWMSNAKEQFVRQADIKPVRGSFTLAAEPGSIYSLSTTTGQQKGSFADIPEAKAFPFPYYETFDEYGDGKEWGYLPRYTADITEAFEIVDRPDQKGKCLRQVVPIRPLAWAHEPMPYTVLGDEQWKDYEVSADVYLNPGDTAGVMGRISSTGTNSRNVPNGYSLTLDDKGRCELVAIHSDESKKNKDGTEPSLGIAQVASVGPNQWHNLKLRFEGTVLTAFVDGTQVLTANDATYAKGMAGLCAGSGKKELSTPYFDNLLINAVNGAVPEPSKALPGQTAMYPSGAR